jgi:phosphatidylglycerol:prolipoprotein diacylglycerol transferase
MWWYGRKTHRNFWEVTDFIAPMVPLGLAAGRWGNFMNGELWGRVSDKAYSWLMVFPQANGADEKLLLTQPDLLNNPTIAAAWQALGGLPRHPSQIYQLLGEGVLLFIVLWLFSRKMRPMGAVSAVFVMGYGLMRFLAEFAREPDDFLGLLSGNLSMGQWLSLPMIAFGIGLMIWSYKKKQFD